MAEKRLSEVPASLREQYEKGVAALQKQNYDYAITILQQVLVRLPGFFQAREALRAAGFKKSGGKGGFFKKVLGTASSSPLLAKGQIALRTNPVDALPIAEQILAADPNSVAGHKLLAEAAMSVDLPRTAALSLEIAFKNSPDRDIAMKLGEALALAGDTKRAEGILSEMARTFPNDPEIAQALKHLSAKRTLSEGGYEGLEDGKGSYRDILKDKAEAVALEQEKREVKSEDVAGRLLADYESRLEKEPQNTRLLRSIAELHLQRNDFERALEAYRRIAVQDGSADPAIERAITETVAKQFQHRIAQLDASAEDYLEKVERIQTEQASLELEEARRRVEKYPNDLALRFDLGQLYLKAGRLSEAIQEFQKAQNNPHRRLQALLRLGQCFSKRGMQDLAARTLQNAIREKIVFDDEKKELIYELGCVLEKMGKRNDAIEQFKLIYEIDIGYRDVAAKVDAHYSSGGA